MERENNLTRKYIMEAFYLLLTKKHYNKITVCDICEKAGVSRMSFYRNFESKEDLLNCGLEQTIDGLHEKVKGLETINQYTITKEIFETFKNFKEIIPSLKDSPVIKTILFSSIEKLKKEGSHDKINKTSKYIPTFYFSAVITTIFEWLKSGAEESTDEMARLITSLVNFDLFQKTPECWYFQVLCET